LKNNIQIISYFRRIVTYWINIATNTSVKDISVNQTYRAKVSIKEKRVADNRTKLLIRSAQFY